MDAATSPSDAVRLPGSDQLGDDPNVRARADWFSRRLVVVAYTEARPGLIQAEQTDEPRPVGTEYHKATVASGIHDCEGIGDVRFRSDRGNA